MGDAQLSRADEDQLRELSEAYQRSIEDERQTSQDESGTAAAHAA